MEDVKCNDGEAMEHYGQTLRVITYDKDRNLTIAHLNILRKRMILKKATYASMLVEHNTKIIIGRLFLVQRFCEDKLLQVLFH